MIIISDSLSDMAGSVVYLQMNCNSKDYPTEFDTYDEAWDELYLNYDHFRRKLGEERYSQLLEMTARAKALYDEGYAKGFVGFASNGPQGSGFEEIKRASLLMQDIEQVIRGKRR